MLEVYSRYLGNNNYFIKFIFIATLNLIKFLVLLGISWFQKSLHFCGVVGCVEERLPNARNLPVFCRY